MGFSSTLSNKNEPNYQIKFNFGHICQIFMDIIDHFGHIMIFLPRLELIISIPIKLETKFCGATSVILIIMIKDF